MSKKYIVLKLKSQLSSFCLAYYWLCLLLLAAYLVGMQGFLSIIQCLVEKPHLNTHGCPAGGQPSSLLYEAGKNMLSFSWLKRGLSVQPVAEFVCYNSINNPCANSASCSFCQSCRATSDSSKLASV